MLIEEGDKVKIKEADRFTEEVEHGDIFKVISTSNDGEYSLDFDSLILRPVNYDLSGSEKNVQYAFPSWIEKIE
jgi:hypothetical protein